MKRVTSCSITASGAHSPRLLVAAILPLVVRGNDVRSTAIVVASLLVSGLVAYALGEWAAERFAKRATRTSAPDRTAWETSR